MQSKKVQKKLLKHKSKNSGKEGEKGKNPTMDMLIYWNSSFIISAILSSEISK